MACVALCCGVVPARAAGPAAPADNARLAVTVVESGNGNPVPGAEAFVEQAEGDGATAEAGADGVAWVEGLRPGRWKVGVGAAGFQKASTDVVIPPGATVAVRLELARNRTSAFETVVTEVDRRARVPVVVGSVSRVNAEDLRARAPLHSNEVLRTLPGVHVVEEDASGLRQSVSIRGLDVRRSRRVLMLEDGVPIGSAPYMDPDMYYTPPIERVDHIDVAKGADTILHGPQTIGGVINHVTGEVPTAPTVRLDLRAGTFGHRNLAFMTGGSWGPWGVRLDVVHRAAAGPRAVDARVLDVSLKVRAELIPGGVTTVRAGVFGEDSRGTYAGLTLPQYRVAQNLNFADHDRYRLSRFALTGRHTQQLAPALRVEVLAYGHRLARDWRRQDFDRSGTGGPYERVVPPQPGANPTTDGGTLYFFRGVSFRNRQSTVAGVEPRVFLKLGPWSGTHHELVAGARLHAEQLAEQVLFNEDTGATDGRTDSAEVNSALALAAFAQYRLSLWETLHLTAGVRAEAVGMRRRILTEEQRGADGTSAPVPVDIQNTTTVAELIPGVGVSYALLREVLLYAGVHRGFAPPRTREAITPDGEDLRLGAEYSWNLEAGVRAAPGRMVTLDAAVFHIDFQNQIIASSQADAVGQTGRPLVNGGRTRQTGAELAARVDAAPLAAWPGQASFTGALTVVDSRFTAGTFNGRTVPYTPPFTASGTWLLTHRAGLSAQASTTLVAPQFTDNANSPGSSVDGLTGALDGYMLWDGRVAWSFGPLTPYVTVKNALNRRYIASRFPQGINPSGFRQVLAGVRLDL